MRGSIVGTVAFALVLSACGGHDDGSALTADDRAKAIQIVEDNLHDCLAAVDASTAKMTVRFSSGNARIRAFDAGLRLAVVAVAVDGYDPLPEFYVQLDGPLPAAATFNHQADVLLDNAANLGAHC
jgi:hypothetical protein